MANILYTFGYEGLSLDEFIRRLKECQVKKVLDVRERPQSRKPGFSKNGLSEALDREGISYAHVSALGCPKQVRDKYKADANWEAYTRGFLRHLSGQTEAIEEVVRLAQRDSCCLVCFEADFNTCHRSFVARAAATDGRVHVVHITGRTTIPDAVSRLEA